MKYLIFHYKSDWMHRGRYIQETFWQIKKEDIVKVQFFTAKVFTDFLID